MRKLYVFCGILTAGLFVCLTPAFAHRGAVLINDGALTASSINVTLSLQNEVTSGTSSITEMCFSNDNVSFTEWEPFSSTKSWTLESGEGFKTVYVKMKNAAGTEVGTPARDTIMFTTATLPATASVIEPVRGRLMVKKPGESRAVPYMIKGVCWSPASIGNSGEGDIAAREAEFVKWYHTDIALMKEMGVNTVRTFLDFGADTAVFRDILDELYANGIMVIMAVDHASGDTTQTIDIVNTYKDHPAILMWQIGNEWNYNNYYNRFPHPANPYEVNAVAAAFTETTAQAIKLIDPFHPVTSILANSAHFVTDNWDETWGDPIETYVNRYIPTVDVWGFNMYLGAGLGVFFYEWENISIKPVFLSEYGTDAFNNLASPAAEDQNMQSQFNQKLFLEVFLNSSARDADRFCLGGTFFEWADEWWKNGTPSAHDSGGFSMIGRHPDGVSDEEYYGFVDVNRVPRQAFNDFKTIYTGGTAIITVPESITVNAQAGNSVELGRDGMVFYQRSGGGGNGRGFNVAIIDPKTGYAVSARNFDTYAYNGYVLAAHQNMIGYVNAVPDGFIILAATCDNVGAAYGPTGELFAASGSTMIGSVAGAVDWAFIGVKGQGVLAEGIGAAAVSASITLVLDMDDDAIADAVDTDWDNDGVDNSVEQLHGTDPRDRDTDHDGESDATDYNHPPVLDTTGDKVVDENVELSFTVTATDPESDILTYVLTGAPTGAAIDAVTGVFFWTPTCEQAGVYTVTFSVSDGRSEDSETITITVNNVNRAPVLSNIENITVYEGQTVTFTPGASDPDGDVLTYSYSGFMSAGTYTTTYDDAGVHTVTVTVSDGALTDFQDVAVVVLDTDIQPPETTIANEISGWHMRDVTLLLSAADAGAGVKATYYTVNDGAVQTKSVSGDPVITANGVSTIEYWSEDNAGNVETRKTVTVSIDKSEPSVAMVSPRPYTAVDSETTKITGTAGDPGSGLSSVAVQLNGQIYPAAVTGGDFSVTGIVFSQGRNDVVVIASDIAGNTKMLSTVIYCGWLLHLEVPLEDSGAPGSGAAVATSILNFIREGVASPLSESQVYEFGHAHNFVENPTLSELDALGMDHVLGYYDPYDPEPSLPQGNSARGYNFTIESFAATEFGDYLKDIAHWMAFPVSTGRWYDTELAAHPYSPAAVPAWGRYDSWVLVHGVSASENPAPRPREDPGYAPDFTLYGLWLSDPAAEGLGRDLFVTAADLELYFKPLISSDELNGKLVHVSEPPEQPSQARLELAADAVSEDSVKLIEVAGVVSDTSAGAYERHAYDASLVVDLSAGVPGDLDWKKLIDPSLLLDRDFVNALDGALAREFYLVRKANTPERYYLVPFDKYVGGRFRTYAAIIVEAATGAFRQATWSKQPVRFVPLTREQALEQEIAAEPSLAGQELTAELICRPGTSPFYPEWDVSPDDFDAFSRINPDKS
jgi:hypothetical protein